MTVKWVFRIIVVKERKGSHSIRREKPVQVTAVDMKDVAKVRNENVFMSLINRLREGEMVNSMCQLD